jgi:hypothetical protein
MFLTSKTNGIPKSHPQLPMASAEIRNSNQKSKKKWDTEPPRLAENFVVSQIDARTPTTHDATTHPTSE